MLKTMLQLCTNLWMNGIIDQYCIDTKHCSSCSEHWHDPVVSQVVPVRSGESIIAATYAGCYFTGVDQPLIAHTCMLSGRCIHALLTNARMTMKHYADVIQKMKYGYRL